MNPTYSGEYLHLYYTDKIRSLFSNIHKAKTDLNEKSIHKLRVEIKKIRAVLCLLEIIFPDDNKLTAYKSPLKQIFRISGKIRKQQLNLASLTHYNLPANAITDYKKYLSNLEKKARVKFKKNLMHSHIKKISRSKYQIKKLSRKVSDKTLSAKCLTFIKREALKIKQLLSSGDSPLIIHRIRMHLKAMNPIVQLLIQINPTDKMKKLSTHIKKTEIQIGNWHDKIVLVISIEKFFKEDKNKVDAGKNIELLKLAERIKKSCRISQKKIKIKVNSTVNPIATLP